MNEAIEVHSELNPKLWDGAKLKEEVKNQILIIVNAFIDYVGVPMKVRDIQLVGSNASYNYTDDSDLDVHIITNFDAVSSDTYLLQLFYNASKSAFNNKYDISIHGVPVELYVEDMETSVHSNGIYSVTTDSWIKAPKIITELPKYDITDNIETWASKINEALKSGDIEILSDMIDRLYIMRKNSIAVDGEFGPGNLIFKELRNMGLVKAIKDKIEELESNNLSLESLSSGELVNTIDYE